MDRRFSSLRTYTADWREVWLLRGLRHRATFGADADARLVLRRPIFAPSKKATRKSPAALQGHKPYGLHAEPRSGRQSRSGRSTQFAGQFREFEASRGCKLVFTFCAAPVYG